MGKRGKVLVLAWLLGCCLVPFANALVENFDEPGATWANTSFSTIIPSGGGTFERQALSTALGAPNTTPALPVNSGGDLEGRYYEAATAPTWSFAVTTGSFTDATIDGYFGFGVVVPFGVPSMGLLLRESGKSTASVNGYLATMGLGGAISPFANSGSFSIQRITNGIGQLLATSGNFGTNQANSNYHLRFSANGSALTASVSQLQVIGGALVEVPISVLTATDSGLTSGAAGVSAFARGQQSIFFDDISVVPEPASGGLLGLGTLLLAARRRRRA